MKAGRKQREPGRAGAKKKRPQGAAKAPRRGAKPPPGARKSSRGRKKPAGRPVELPRRKKARVAERPRRIVSAQMAERAGQVFGIWALRKYQERNKPLEYLAREIGLTRPALSKLVRRKGGFLFTTFFRACFLQASGEAVIEIVAEGCKLQLRWAIAQGNVRFLSDEEEPR